MLTAHLNQKIQTLIPSGGHFAIAYSGGGDSTAIIHALKDHPQAGPAFIVDHDLRRGSRAEAQAAHDFASSCGYSANVLTWQHGSPTTALQEKARKARYGLMGDACRNAGVKYLLTAHSKDDQAETLLMRYDRKTDWRGAAGMRELTYGPVWPELAMVNVVRPLLGISRHELRAYNKAHKLSWAEDPSNQNRNYARIRARDYLARHPDMGAFLLETAEELRHGVDKEREILQAEFKASIRVDAYGILYLAKIPSPELLAHLLRAAGGQGMPIDRGRVKRLRKEMMQSNFKAATLAGALVKPHKSGYFICRDLVAVKGRHETTRPVSAGEDVIEAYPKIWDGRYVHGGVPGFVGEGENRITSLYVLRTTIKNLGPDRFKNLPAEARPTLPAWLQEGGLQSLGYHHGDDLVIKCLVQSRLHAALGLKTP
ncbi:MAG: tRNA lysidine(34) synthetase TilS [Hellea sp.]